MTLRADCSTSTEWSWRALPLIWTISRLRATVCFQVTWSHLNFAFTVGNCLRAFNGLRILVAIADMQDICGNMRCGVAMSIVDVFLIVETRLHILRPCRDILINCRFLRHAPFPINERTAAPSHRCVYNNFL